VTAAVVVLCGVLGLLIGSFLNVVIWRVPRGESVVRPPSHCPRCETRLAARDNVPVLSWLVLRGRCRSCRGPISARYPLVEAGTAALFAGTAARLAGVRHGWAVLPAYLVFVAVCIALALIDLDTKRLPNVLTLPMYAVGPLLLGIPAAAYGDGRPLLRAAEGLAVLYGVYFLLCFGTGGRGLGFGDVKLAGILGLYLGWLGWRDLAVGVLAAHVVGGVLAIGLLVAQRAGRKSAVPFGPFLVAGALIGLFAGHALGQAWLGSST
jgi:leader peptidase (prepilin peptidase)/N-methyltransferase